MIIPEDIKSSLIPRDRGFFNRVYNINGDISATGCCNDGLKKYKKRIYRIGFENKKHILDAGCGFGQWSFAMAQTSKKITGIDISLPRIKVSRRIAKENNFSNVSFLQNSIKKLPFKDETFDAIFCYSIIYSTDYQKTLKEFFRVLKKSGLLYCSSNSWGWLVYNLVKNPYPSIDFNPRKYAFQVFLNSIRFNITHKYVTGKDLVMSPKKTKLLLENLGFKKILIGSEGKLKHWDIKEKLTSAAFYQEKYFGLTNTFEVLTEK